MKTLLLIMFLFSSCQIKRVGDPFIELSFLKDINLNLNYLNKGVIDRPHNSWVKLLSYDSRFGEKRCLVYKTPFKTDKGILKEVGNRKGKCDFFENVKPLYDKLTSFYFLTTFSTRFSSQKYLKFRFIKGEKHINIDVPLLNYTKVKKYQKYDNQLSLSFVEDISFGKSLIQKKIEVGKLCYGVNNECRTVVKNNCDKCKNGSYEVVDFNCSNGGSRFCGNIECGKKNMPACPRGYEILETKLLSLCFDGSPAGICKVGLRTFCREDKILICI